MICFHFLNKITPGDCGKRHSGCRETHSLKMLHADDQDKFAIFHFTVCHGPLNNVWVGLGLARVSQQWHY